MFASSVDDGSYSGIPPSLKHFGKFSEYGDNHASLFKMCTIIEIYVSGQKT